VTDDPAPAGPAATPGSAPPEGPVPTADPAPTDGPAATDLPWELPEELRIDTATARQLIAGFIRGQLRQAGFERALLGLSGGIDSALVAYLVAEAIGPERLLCILMPYRTSSPASRADAEEVVARLGCPSRLVDISPIVDGYFGDPGEDGRAPVAGAGGDEALQASALRRGNFMARARMMVLYDSSVTWSGLVVGTGNKTESLIGYTTLFGDSACAFNPIGDLYKSQVRQLSLAMDVPDAILRKAPSADLWPGQTDEVEAGFTYHELDRLLYWMIDRRRGDDELVALGFDAATIARVARLVAGSEFKRQVPPIAKLGPRTTGVDYLYPRRRPGSARS
jgi:NAD+ synthase